MSAAANQVLPSGGGQVVAQGDSHSRANPSSAAAATWSFSILSAVHKKLLKNSLVVVVVVVDE